MAALADYLDLRFAVGDHVGNRNLSDVMSRFVLLAEDMLNKRLRCRQQITSATLTLTNGVVSLPADFLEMVNVYGVDGLPLFSAPLADIQREGSQYYRYAINGTQMLIKGFSGTRNIEYFSKIPTLTTSPTTSNWLLADAPDVYLYAVALEATIFLKDTELGLGTKALLDGAMANLKVADDRARWSNTPTRVQGVCP